MEKQSYQALVEAELPIHGTFWIVEAVAQDGVHLSARGKKECMPLETFMKEAGLKNEDFDPATIAASAESRMPHPEQEVASLDGVKQFEIYRTDSVYERKSPLDLPSYPEIRIDRNFDLHQLDRFVVLDTEATGLSAYEDRLIQLSAIRYVNGRPEESYNTYLNPHKEMTDGAVSVTNMRSEFLEDAPDFSEIADSFREFVGSDPLVGYFILFDLRMLWCAGMDLISGHTIYDAQWYVFRRIPKGFLTDRKLGTVAKYLNVDFPAHNSLGDSYATGEIFLKTVREMTEG